MSTDARDQGDHDRLFVKDGFRHYRRRYSRAELGWGLASGASLLAIAWWVAWRGMHPDPSLLEDPAALLDKAGGSPLVVPVEASPAAGRGTTSAGPVERGPLPANLSGGGFREDKVSSFDAENLYVKINGRADYFKAFGFRKLHALLLVSEADPAVTIDLEMYDLANTANALGAYGGERGAEVKPEADEAGLYHLDRNALYMARGPYYLRVIGSDESPAVRDKLISLRDTLRTGIKGDALPWAYGFFVGGLGLDPAMVSYFAEGAFSFSFATDVWTARPGGRDSDLELFVSVLGGPAEAKTRAAAFEKGFLDLGQPAGKAHGIRWAKDQFLGTLSGATAVERWVVGVRGAANQKEALEHLDRLRSGLVQLPSEAKDRARPAATSASGGPADGDSYE